MRLFISIDLDPQIKQRLHDYAVALKKTSKRGSITRTQNMHITLVFVGECDFPERVERAMSRVVFQPFSISLDALGSFHRGGTRLYWVGIKEQEVLDKLQNDIMRELEKDGILLKKRKFHAHITIARQMVLPKQFNEEEFSESIESMKMQVETIGLMQSEFVDGAMQYHCLYQRNAI